MAVVYLSRADLALVDMGIRVLQAAQGIDDPAVRRTQDRLQLHGIDLTLDSVENSVVLEIGEVAKWKEYAQAAVAVVGAAAAVYKAYKSGVEFEDRVLSEHFNFEPNMSLEELIEARHEMERSLFEAGG